jgi:hypothetical protein
MTPEKDNGGPAFPAQPKYATLGGDFIEHVQGGMSLRDWFAGKAFEEDILFWQDRKFDAETGLMVATYTREQARYRYADAMLEARK